MIIEESKTIEVCGIDPGTTYFGYAHIALKGLVELVNKEGQVVAIIPDVDFQVMQRWNLKTRQIFTRTKDGKRLIRSIDVSTDNEQKEERKEKERREPDELQYWSNALSDTVAQTEDLFTRYDSLLSDRPLPVVVTENQADKHKGKYGEKANKDEKYKRYEMSVISYVFRYSIRAIDSRHGDERMSVFAGKKYNMPSDGSIGNRMARKKCAVKVLKELLCRLALTDVLAWLNEMERLGEQIHDIADAVLLAIQTSLKLADIKKDMTQKQSTAKYTRVNIPVRQMPAPPELELANAIKPVKKLRVMNAKASVVTTATAGGGGETKPARKTVETTLMGKTFIVTLAPEEPEEPEEPKSTTIFSQKKPIRRNKRKAEDPIEDEPTEMKKRKCVKLAKPTTGEWITKKRKADSPIEKEEGEESDTSRVLKKPKYRREPKLVTEKKKKEVVEKEKKTTLNKRKADSPVEEEELIEKKKRKYVRKPKLVVEEGEKTKKSPSPRNKRKMDDDAPFPDQPIETKKRKYTKRIKPVIEITKELNIDDSFEDEPKNKGFIDFSDFPDADWPICLSEKTID
jgi:hypothetical protein